LLFENYGQEVGEDNTLLVPPTQKLGEPVSCGPYGSCAYVLIISLESVTLNSEKIQNVNCPSVLHTCQSLVPMLCCTLTVSHYLNLNYLN